LYRGLLDVPEYQQHVAEQERKKKEEEARAAADYQRRLAADMVGVEQFSPFLGLNTQDPEAGLLAKYAAPTDVVPAFTTAKAGAGLLSAALGALFWNQARKQAVSPGTLTHLGYHGTPHTWKPEPGYPLGRARLGEETGQGAAMYGKGVYIAEEAGVSREMFDQLTDQRKRIISSEAGEMELSPWRVSALEENPGALNDMGDDLARILKDTRNRIDNPKSDWDQMYAGELEKTYLKQLKTLEDFKRVTGYGEKGHQVRGVVPRAGDPLQLTFPKKGGVYRLDVPDEVIPDLLDLNRSIKDQAPHVQKRLDSILDKFDPKDPGSWRPDSDSSYGITVGPLTHEGVVSSLNTGEYYKALRLAIGDDEAARLLEEVGIPGVKYFDAGSRVAEEGTRNFAIFADDVLKRIKVLGIDK
jgi:hypothetical protein